MNIKQVIQSFLDSTGMPPSQLAKDAGCSVQSITRLLKGQRQGMNSKTWEKLLPIVCPDGQASPESRQ